MRLRFLLASMCFVAAIAATSSAQNEYQANKPSNRMREKAKQFSLADTAPQDCRIDIDFKGNKQQFAQLRYGTEDSIRVIFVLDHLSDKEGDFDLYVDTNRDRRIQPKEKVKGTGKIRDIEIPTEVMTVGVPNHTDRTLQFRSSFDGSHFSLRTMGGYLAQCSINGTSHNVWRMDGNANGLYSDTEDELWIDIDQDGKWNPIRERFPFRSAIKIGDQRFAVRGDQLGSKIEFAKIEGEGKLSLDLKLDADTSITGIRASIFGNDGSAHSIEDTKPIVLPIGKYMLGQISLQLKRGDERLWKFSFSHSGNPNTQRWIEVTTSGETVIEPFKDLEFSVVSPNKYTSGKSMSVRPSLKTGDNLYITSSGRGKKNRWDDTGGNKAKIVAVDRGQREIASDSSGFA